LIPIGAITLPIAAKPNPSVPDSFLFLSFHFPSAKKRNQCMSISAHLLRLAFYRCELNPFVAGYPSITAGSFPVYGIFKIIRVRFKIWDFSLA
jgi:hypothetical protein